MLPLKDRLSHLVCVWPFIRHQSIYPTRLHTSGLLPLMCFHPVMAQLPAARVKRHSISSYILLVSTYYGPGFGHYLRHYLSKLQAFEFPFTVFGSSTCTLFSLNVFFKLAPFFISINVV